MDQEEESKVMEDVSIIGREEGVAMEDTLSH